VCVSVVVVVIVVVGSAFVTGLGETFTLQPRYPPPPRNHVERSTVLWRASARLVRNCFLAAAANAGLLDGWVVFGIRRQAPGPHQYNLGAGGVRFDRPSGDRDDILPFEHTERSARSAVAVTCAVIPAIVHQAGIAV
jgi:hypothetical protein